MDKNEIIIYQTEDGKTHLDVKMKDETIWLTQSQIAQLFDVQKPAISKHLKNIFECGELEENSVVSILETTANDGKAYKTNYYNLDAIISVGYRVNSSKATKFRIWATTTLRTYLTQGYVINEEQLKLEKDKVKTLQNAINLLTRSLNNQIETVDDAKQVANILDKFAKGLDFLDNFDHKTLDTKGNTQKTAIIIHEEEFLEVIDKMKSEFASDVFAQPKDKSFSSSVNQIYQSFDGNELYPTLEEKAAMLLYLITKNHSFSDGNKRIAASCFLYFLNKNGILYKNDKPIISNETLFALTLLIAESNPAEMETMKQVTMSILNNNEFGEMV